MASSPGDLLTPTLTEHEPRTWTGRLPWRLSSLVYPSILGGPAAATIVAVIEARRLRASRATTWVILAVGVAALVAATAAIAEIESDALRVIVAALGLLTYGVAYRLLRAADRVHSTFSPHDDPDDDYELFFIPAVAAVLVGWILQGALLLAVGGVE